EVCALGDLWLLDDLAQKGLVSPPFMVTIFFGRPGGSWSPATIDEFMHRVKALPAGTFQFASVTGPAHLQLETVSVLSGGPAPSARALQTSVPRRKPLSTITPMRPFTASTTSRTVSIGAREVSSTRPPWFEMMTASAPRSAARSASPARCIPLTMSLRGHRR